jgi:glucose/arabinose dehydrogenase/cytochrome c2
VCWSAWSCLFGLSQFALSQALATERVSESAVEETATEQSPGVDAARQLSGNAASGKQAFIQRCLICHSAEWGDGGGQLGPNLASIVGVSAAGGDFNYSTALRESNLVWDRATLHRYLKAPLSVVQGTTMRFPLADDQARADVIAYLEDQAKQLTKAGEEQAAYTAADINADWRKDVPTKSYRIKPDQLAAPNIASAARNFPLLVTRPIKAKLEVPFDFHVGVFADKLEKPRTLLAAPNGDVLVCETASGRIRVLRPANNGEHAEQNEIYVSGLKLPYGMVWYPNAQNPQWLYVAENHRIVRFLYRPGDLKARMAAEVVIAKFGPEAPAAGESEISKEAARVRDDDVHALALSADAKRLFVSINAISDSALDLPEKKPAQIKTWETQQAVGAAWGYETKRANVLVFEVGNTMGERIFATGLRTCNGLAIQPATQDVWCTVNERNGLGDDLVPDFSTRLRDGGFYGWPWYYIGGNEDPRLKGARVDLKDKVTTPDVLYTAHSGAQNMVFYSASSGRAVFPSEYRGDAFVTLNGSLNRSKRTGHKIVRVLMKNNVPTGEYEDFLIGFIVTTRNVWGKPAGLTVASDGALLMSDDGAGVIYRISYRKP